MRVAIHLLHCSLPRTKTVFFLSELLTDLAQWPNLPCSLPNNAFLVGQTISLNEYCPFNSLVFVKGCEKPIADSPPEDAVHFLKGTTLHGPFPENTETVMFGVSSSTNLPKQLKNDRNVIIRWAVSGAARRCSTKLTEFFQLRFSSDVFY
jgi:hypothetical protein